MSRVALMDRMSLVATLALTAIGILFIYSATSFEGGSNRWVKQLIWVCCGLIVYFVLSHLDYKRLVDRGHIFYLLGLVSLVAVLIWGFKANGARSWFRLGPASLQPSEFMKIAAILFMAKFFTRVESRRSSFVEFVVSVFLVSLPVVLIAMQPDLGTALVYLPLILIPNFLHGRKEAIWLSLVGIIMAGVLVLSVLYKPDWVVFLKDYQKERILTFVFPDRDTSNAGYQVHQSKISIGQGGFLGLGLGKGKQTQLGFLPEKDSDFILAVVAEEFGFLGILTVLGLFFLILQRGLLTAFEAGDAMGSILAALVVGVLALQMLFNAAMLVGLVPTTGIPCPLVSYGGSSMITSYGLLGLIQSVRTHRFVNH
ncbi:MAG: rod shape-determining protein RodA [Acidobacteria bacterium]|nr:rod shape-determining protein RodA [Acidobacteriota bacterium]